MGLNPQIVEETSEKERQYHMCTVHRRKMEAHSPPPPTLLHQSPRRGRGGWGGTGEGPVGSQGSSGHIRGLHEAGWLPRGPVRPQRGGAGWGSHISISERGNSAATKKHPPTQARQPSSAREEARRTSCSPMRK